MDTTINIGQEELAIIDEMIEANNGSLHINDNSSRFSGSDWYEQARQNTVFLAGIGGIGSWAALILSRIQPAQMYLCDDDNVEMVNMSGQLYSMENIGSKKVDALGQTLRDFSNYHSSLCIPERFTEESEAQDIMICGFDNMAARKLVFKSWLNHVKLLPMDQRRRCLFIDGRLAAEKWQIFAICGDDYYNMKRYMTDFLFEDSEAEQTVCSYKQTTYCASMIASYMCNLYVNYLCDSIARPVPFFLEYDATTMFLKSEM